MFSYSPIKQQVTVGLGRMPMPHTTQTQTRRSLYYRRRSCDITQIPAMPSSIQST